MSAPLTELRNYGILTIFAVPLDGEVDGGALGEEEAVCVTYQAALNKASRFKALADQRKDIRIEVDVGKFLPYALSILGNGCP